MYNKPSGTFAKVTLGPGVVKMGATGATPTQDVGFVEGGAVLTFERTQVEIRQGSPQTIIDALASAENAMIEFEGIEWNFDNILRMLGDGATSVSAPDEILQSGGRPKVDQYALQFVHVAADGSTYTLNMWKVIGDGTIAISVNKDSEHRFPYKFKAVDPGTTDWGSNALSDGTKLFKLIRTPV